MMDSHNYVSLSLVKGIPYRNFPPCRTPR